MKKLNIYFLVLIFLGLSIQVNSQCTNGTMYAVNGATNSASNLYSMDPATGAVTLIGATGFSHVTGLAAHPTTGILYGVVSDLFGSNTTQLITINSSTGVGTLIGTTGHQIPDIAFNSAGVLYGWSECNSDCSTNDDLVTINLATGAVTVVGECGCGTARTGLAFDSGNNLYMKDFSSLHLMNSATGTIISSVGLSNGNTTNHLTFSATNVLYTGERSGGSFTLQTINIGTGVVTNVGSNGIGSMSGIEFCKAATVASTPTLGEWGLINFTLLVLSLATIFALQRQRRLSLNNGAQVDTTDQISAGSLINGFRSNSKSLFLILAIAFGMFTLVFGIATKFFQYELTSADIPGSLIASLIVTGLIHSLLMNRKK